MATNTPTLTLAPNTVDSVAAWWYMKGAKR